MEVEQDLDNGASYAFASFVILKAIILIVAVMGAAS